MKPSKKKKNRLNLEKKLLGGYDNLHGYYVCEKAKLLSFFFYLVIK